jgi:hypothetical protein
LNFQLKADEHVKVPFRVRAAAFERLQRPLMARFRSEVLIEVRKELFQDLLYRVEGFEVFQILLAALGQAYKVVELLSVEMKSLIPDHINLTLKLTHLKLSLIRTHSFPLPLFFLH